jgi:hypothetical protein
MVVANWLILGKRPLGAALAPQVKEVRTFADASGPLYYVVYLDPAGLVFMPADDLVEPIIGFAPEMKDYDPSLDNPLGALVSQDMPGRVLQARYLERATQALGGEFVPSGGQQRSQTKWAALEQGEVPATLSLGGLTSGLPDAQIDDMRVSPLLGQIRWAQDTVNGQACYNYYTPPNAAANPANFPSGCVATAMAQIMRKHQHPSAPNAGTFNISVNGVAQPASIRGGNGAAGNYDWANMAADPLASGVNETQRQAIGALTYDAGVSVGMSYSPMANGGSSADTLDAATAFRNTFKYTNAKNAFNDWNNFRFADLYDIVNPNLDAGYPVLFGIRRPVAGGSHGYHAIAADGYGYHLLTLYHHLNMGWADAQNIWYELPNIDATARLYDTVTKIVYNVFITGTGEIVSGRVLNSCGGAVSGVSVTATGGGQTFNATTNTNGIYALAKLPPNNNYTISVNQAGYQSQVVYVGTSQDRTTNTGNVWAVDFKVNRGPVNAEYVLYNLGVLDQKVSVAYAINNLSQVAGGMRVNNSSGNYHPCLWAETEKGKFGFYRFGTDVVDYGELHGISDNGLAVGWAYKAIPGVTVDKNPIYVQQVGTSLNLGNLPIPTTGLGGMVPEGRAYGVNNNGTIVGHAIFGQNDLAPCSWASTSSMPQRVGTLGYGGGTDQTRATRINQAGWIVGKHNNQAFLWNGGSVTMLGPAGSNSEARGLTNLNPPTIVGLMGIFDYLSQIGSNAVIFNGAAIQALDATRGKASHGVNSQGQIVGTSSEGAFVYDQARGMRNLNLLVNAGDWNLKEAFSINDNGEIVGWGWYKCVLPFAYMLRPLYTITATAGTGGTISPDGAVKVIRGYDQTFNFAPDPGYQIANVVVDGVSQGAITSYTFSNVTANHTISVTFVAGTTNYKIIATAGAGGTIAPAGTILVASGSSKTFIITPNSGYQIADVIVDDVSKGPISSYTFGDVRGNHIIEASFTPGGVTYTITASAGTGGTISPSGAITVNSGGSQTFNIAANSGYQIADVKVDNVSKGAISTYTFSSVNANHTIAASFTPVTVTYTIAASADTGGTISPSGNVTVNSGGSQTFTITPTAGYRVDVVKVDNVSQGAISTYTFSNVTANHTISATFVINTGAYTINASSGSGGSVSPSGAVQVNAGASQTFTMTCNSGYVVNDVLVDGSSVGSANSYTFTNVSANHTISASFKKPGSCGAFFDHFDGGQLGSTWTVRNPDPARYSISNSFLHTTTQPGALFTTTPFYSNLFLIPNPVGNCDFQMTLKVSGYLPGNGNGQEICLIAYVDAHNFVKCSNTFASNQRCWNLYRLQDTVFYSTFDYTDAYHTEFYMRLTKVGNTYRLYSSVDGVNYGQRTADMTFSGSTPPYLGFIAIEDPWIQASPVSVDIDYFAVDSLNTPNKKGTIAGSLELLLLSD